MRHGLRIVFWVTCVIAVTPTAWGEPVRTVCESGCEFVSLQEAVDSSDWGGTIELGPGMYVENVVLQGALTIRGAGAERTVIEGAMPEAVIRLEGPSVYRVQLEDLTVRTRHRGAVSAGVGEVSLERCVVREAESGSQRKGSRGVAGPSDRAVRGRAWKARHLRDGLRSTSPSVSLTGARSIDVVSGRLLGDALSDFASSRGGPDSETTLCHIPPGNPESARTIRVAQTAVQAHLQHGDLLGGCPYECDGVPSPVAQTGQTTSYEPGDDGEYQAGVSIDPRFTDNGDGTVMDNLTGLTWLRRANCFGWRDWYEALSDANTLADGSCGLTDGSMAGDWRLPNVRELQSLIDYGTDVPAFPSGHPFIGVQSTNYWSSTTFAAVSSGVWGVYFRFGDVASYTKSGAGYVWPVRGGQ